MHNTTRVRYPKYKVGELVHVSCAKLVFKKAYESGWTLELFRIIRISTERQPPVYYTLEDLDGEPIEGFFYEEELSRVQTVLNTESFQIDKILKTEGKGKKNIL